MLDPAITGPAGTVALVLGSTIVMVSLLLDANWMWAMLNRGMETTPPPLFKSRIPLPTGWRRLLWLGGLVFGAAPFLMQGVMEVGGHLPPTARSIQMIVLAAGVGLLFFAEHRKWKQASTLAAVVVGLALISPYALAGPFGWRAYAVVTGLLAAILGLLYLAFAIHRVALGWRPGTPLVAGLRLAIDGAVIVALLVGVYWPMLAPH